MNKSEITKISNNKISLICLNTLLAKIINTLSDCQMRNNSKDKMYLSYNQD